MNADHIISFINEVTQNKEAKKPSNDYIKVAQDLLKRLKSLEPKPNSIELEFSIKLAMTSGKALAWIMVDIGADATLGVKMKWEDKKS